MRFSSLIIAGCVFGLGLGGAAGAESETISPDVLSVLEGEGWVGTLTYRNYEAPYDEEVIPVELSEVERVEDGILFGMKYPGEAEANSSEALFVSEDGTELGGATIQLQTEMGNSLVIITRDSCEDDFRPATCERIYRIGSNAFSMAKEVILEDGSERFVRNRYDFKR
ncbi:MAG: hypothetical protein CMK09_18950 [Ponticaulis sp.]|nr:hypothetical protein [Ponticaulis sp.]|tara:strand:- start:161209 stop:161712 length:504 start_codon:yes stop_codon:yes gene_type:complete